MEKIEKRECPLSDSEIERYNLPYNPIWQAYRIEFNRMFRDFSGESRTEDQKKWYVFQRWDSETRKHVPDNESPEERLLEFVQRERGKSAIMTQNEERSCVESLSGLRW